MQDLQGLADPISATLLISEVAKLRSKDVGDGSAQLAFDFPSGWELWYIYVYIYIYI